MYRNLFVEHTLTFVLRDAEYDAISEVKKKLTKELGKTRIGWSEFVILATKALKEKIDNKQ